MNTKRKVEVEVWGCQEQLPKLTSLKSKQFLGLCNVKKKGIMFCNQYDVYLAGMVFYQTKALWVYFDFKDLKTFSRWKGLFSETWMQCCASFNFISLQTWLVSISASWYCIFWGLLCFWLPNICFTPFSPHFICCFNCQLSWKWLLSIRSKWGIAKIPAKRGRNAIKELFMVIWWEWRSWNPEKRGVMLWGRCTN